MLWYPKPRKDPSGFLVCSGGSNLCIVTPSLTSANVGFDIATIGIGLPFSPIYILANSLLSNCTIIPPLPKSLSLDLFNHVITGVYYGEEVKQKYQVTCDGHSNSVTFPLTLSFSNWIEMSDDM